MGGLTVPSESEAFQNVVAAFAKEEGQPNAAPEGVEAQPPTPEPASQASSQNENPEGSQNENQPAAEKTEPQKLEDEFIEFTGKQKERFNSVYGRMRQVERENAELQRRLLSQQPAPQPVAPQPVAQQQPQPFTEVKPKLSDFESVEQWEEAATAWIARKATQDAVQSIQQKLTEQQTQQQRQTEEARVQQYLASKVNEGYQKFGQVAFDNVCSELAHFAPYGSVMNQTIFGLQRGADVIMELGKNLQEADRISNLHPHDQIYELKALEKKLITKEGLQAKAEVKTPTKVEQPGSGHEVPAAGFQKLKREALASDGDLDSFAKLFLTEHRAASR